METLVINNGKNEITKEQAIFELKTLTSSLNLPLQGHIDYHNIIDFIAGNELNLPTQRE